MATIYAMAGKKTILIGADLRKPKLYIDFDKENRLGLSSYLTKPLSTKQIIKKSEIVNLDESLQVLSPKSLGFTG